MSDARQWWLLEAITLQDMFIKSNRARREKKAARTEELVSTVKQLHDFIVPLEDEMLVYVSRYVLRRPADCLTKLKRRLQERMIYEDNDTAPRLWSPPSAVGLGLLYSASEGAVNLQFSSSNPSGEEMPWLSEGSNYLQAAPLRV